MILRPYGIIIDGALELGLEIVIENGVIAEVRPHTGIPELFVVSSAFINAHSHLEYRGLMGKIDEPEYSGWIREITRLKKLQTPEEILEDCRLAARENIATGIAYIYEHSDRPHAAAALAETRLHGAIYQEVITILEHESPEEKLQIVNERANQNRRDLQIRNSRSEIRVTMNPHAYHTVDRETLKLIAEMDTPKSIHAAETPFENQLTRDGTGPISDFYRANGVPVEPTGKSVIASLDDLHLVSGNTQLVHCCAVDENDIDLIRRRGATVAHCPRSNTRLQCPPAPIRELIDAGVHVGIGLDSAASSGPVDMFSEMRAALQASIDRNRPISAEEVWRMATKPSRDIKDFFRASIQPGSEARFLIKIHLRDALNTEQIIEQASPSLVEWI